MTLKMEMKNWKQTQELETLAQYKDFYASIAELPLGEKSMAIHNKLIDLSRVWLNPDRENDTFAIAKNGWDYSIEMDKWVLVELEKAKNLLDELKDVESYNNYSRIQDGESYFLGFLKMEVILRYRPLLAASWRVETR